jgi:hypothetical protein
VQNDVPLSKLHRVIQAAMGWDGYHMHHFAAGGELYGEPDPDFDLEISSERTARLATIAPREKSRFTYVYDFGDNWEHDILVEKVLPVDPEARYPRCVAGKRACPPEDCGGPWGYADLQEALADPDHPEHENMAEWAGEDFDPAAFDLAEVNRRLKSVR